MGLLKRLFANPLRQVGHHSQSASQVSLWGSSQHSVSPMVQENATDRELLRLVLRETLNQAGIPPSWIGADELSATSRGREPGIRVRLLMKHWDPRLMRHGVAFEQAFKKGVLTIDPQADSWLLGISWQCSLTDKRGCPPLPHPGVWTSGIPSPITQAPVKIDEPVSDPNDLLGGSILIAGPAATPDSSAARPAARGTIHEGARHGPTESTTDARADAKADLERLFAVRDADQQRHRDKDASDHQFAATQPAPLSVLPAEHRSTETQADQLQESFAKTDVFRLSDLKKQQQMGLNVPKDGTVQSLVLIDDFK
jgi:hypothetical protein